MKLPIASKLSVKLRNVVFHTESEGSCSKLPMDIFSPRVGLCLEVKTSNSLKGQEDLTSDVKKLHVQD